MQLLFPNKHNSVQGTGISHIWDFITTATFEVSLTNAPLNKQLLCKTRLFSNHQVPSESCQASQKSPGRQAKAGPSDLIYTALHFLMDTKGQCVLCGTGTTTVPQMHHSNVNWAQATTDKDFEVLQIRNFFFFNLVGSLQSMLNEGVSYSAIFGAFHTYTKENLKNCFIDPLWQSSAITCSSQQRSKAQGQGRLYPF